MSWKPEVIADATGQWYGNALRFATQEEARDNAADLSMRWMAVRAFRATESADPVTHTWGPNGLESIPANPEDYDHV